MELQIFFKLNTGFSGAVWLVLAMLLLPGITCAGTVEGTVTDQSGLAVQGAQVTLKKVLGLAVFELGVADTDASGHYRFADVDGNLYLSAQTDDLHTTGLPGGGVCITPYDCWNELANQHYVGESDSVTLADIVLSPAGALDITPLFGSVASNLAYKLEISNASHAPNSFEVNGQGQMRIGHLPPGDYALKLSPDGDRYLGLCADDTAFDTLVNVPCQGSPAVQVQASAARTLPFHLQQGIRFSGQVTDAHSGEPAGVLVELVDTNHPALFASATTQTNGYTFGPLLPRTYAVKFVGGERYHGELFDDVPCADDACELAGATLIAPQAGEQITHIDASLEPRQRISGQVLDADTLQPLAGVTVHKMHAKPLVFPGGWHWETDASIKTDSQGEFQFSGVAPGGFTLRAEDPHNSYVGLQLPGIDCDFGNAFCYLTPVNESNGQWLAPYTVNPDQALTGLTIALHAGANLSGAVINSATGGPLSGAVVELADAADPSRTLSTRTDASGHYTSLAFNAITVKVSANNQAAGQLYQNIACASGFSCDYSTGTSVAVASGQHVTQIDFSLPPDADTLFSSGFDPL